jgi:membrane-associated phospholipid phosphatase
VRLAWYFLAMGLVFYALPPAVRLLGVADADVLLQSADSLLLARPVADYFDAVRSPALTEVMVLAYLFFFYYLLLGPAHYCFRDLAGFRSCCAGLFSIYAVGLLCYSVLPAGGPHLAQHFAAPLASGPLGRLMLPVIDRSSNGIDVFPSIHVAVSAYLLGFDAQHHRRRFWRLLLPCVALCMSTLYLRYHYLTDLLAGAVLALAGLLLAGLYRRSRLEGEIAARDAG